MKLELSRLENLFFKSWGRIYKIVFTFFLIDTIHNASTPFYTAISRVFPLMKGCIQDDKDIFYLPRQYLEKSRKSQ